MPYDAERRNLRQTIISAIKTHIAERGLMPGDRLATEREMAEAFGVSRASVREAIKILEAIGVLEARPKHGISVKEFNPRTFFKHLLFVPYIDKKMIVDVFELRLSVELGISKLVAERIKADEIEAMRQQLEAMRKAIKNTFEFHTHNYRFHLEIYRAVRNPSIQALGRVLFEFFVTAHWEWWNREVIQPEHFKNEEHIFYAVEARNPDRLQQAVRDHYDTCLWQWLRRGEISQAEATSQARQPNLIKVLGQKGEGAREYPFRDTPKENLRQSIINAIKRQIVEEGLMPGDRLATEREMAQAFGVSRASVREATKILEAIGVLESRPKHGISVREFDPQALFKYMSFVPFVDRKTIVEMSELRCAFDQGIAELAIERIKEDELDTMQQHVQAMGKTLHRPVEFYTHDWAFHLAVYEATKNSSIQALGRLLIEFFVTAHREWWERDVRVKPEHFVNHERIFLALKARDLESTQEAIGDHFKTGLWQWLRRDEFNSEADGALLLPDQDGELDDRGEDV